MQKLSRSNTRKQNSAMTRRVNNSEALPREFAMAASALRHFTKRIVSTGTIASNGSGFVAASTMASTNSVTALGDFSAIAGIYSNYRVRAIRVTANPFYPNPTYSGAAIYTVTPVLCVVPFRSGLVPTTFAGFIESSEAKLASGYKGGVFSTSNKGYPDGQLWHPTNAVIASADSFGLAVMGQSGVAGTASINVWALVIEYLCEFTVEN